VPQHGEILERWARASAHARERSVHSADLRYGDGPNETLDVFPANRPDAPVLVFIHGGWWRALDKRDHSFLAPSFADAGAMVVVPNYALCPAVKIETIALQMTQAIAWTWRHAVQHGGDPARIVVAGHSAGGHLAAMLLCCDWRAVGRDLPAQLVKAALSVSGVFDLEPLRHTPFLKDDLRLTPRAVARLSPVRFPAPRGRLYAVAGALESEEFLRHNVAIRDAWGADAVPVCETVPDANHFDVLHHLADPEDALHRRALELLGLAPAAA
jgi:arylformamidase